MTPTLPFSAQDMEVLHGPGTEYFRRRLHGALVSLKSLFEEAAEHGLSMEIQESYDDLRIWLFSHQRGVRQVLSRRDAGSSAIATWSLEGVLADRLYNLIASGSIEVEAGASAGCWRNVLNSLIREAAGRSLGPARLRKR